MSAEQNEVETALALLPISAPFVSTATARPASSVAVNSGAACPCADRVMHEGDDADDAHIADIARADMYAYAEAA